MNELPWSEGGRSHRDGPATERQLDKDTLPLKKRRTLRIMYLTCSAMTAEDVHLCGVELWGPAAYSTYRSRLKELEDMGLVERTGDKAPISTGRFAETWVLTDLGFATARDVKSLL